MKLLTVVIPCYNSQEYLRRCVESLLPGGEEIEILIVNDGSVDNTAVIAEEYQNKNPGIVRVFHQENKGHGGAINTGIRNAVGTYLKVVDSDDWVDPAALSQVVGKLKILCQDGTYIDMLLTNFVYEKVGKNRKAVMRYRRIFPKNRIFTWGDVGHCRKGNYILMHSILYKISILRDNGFSLPEHTFYVDNLFAYLPFPHVKTMCYLDVDFYHYFIGRVDQSINEKIMIKRVDQQIKVNKLMLDLVDLKKLENKKMRSYLFNYLEIITTVTIVLLVCSGVKGNLIKRNELWQYFKNRDIWLYRRLRFGIFGLATNIPGWLGRKITLIFYRLSQKIYGFN